jgi:hypothetical protein
MMENPSYFIKLDLSRDIKMNCHPFASFSLFFQNNRISCFIHNDNILMRKWATASHLLSSK